MKKTILFICIWISILTLCSPANAQMDESIIGSLGGEIGNSNLTLIHSVGDIVGTSIGTPGQTRLVQGYVQCFECDNCIVTGLEEAYVYPSVKMYPNPTHDLLIFEGEQQLIYRYELFNLFGQQLLEDIIQDSYVSLAVLTSGLYLIRVYGIKGELSLLGKVVRQ